MKAENQKQDCIKGVTEMEKQEEKQDSENQDLITEEDDLHHINNKNKEQMKLNQQEEELQGMSFTDALLDNVTQPYLWNSLYTSGRGRRDIVGYCWSWSSLVNLILASHIPNLVNYLLLFCSLVGYITFLVMFSCIYFGSNVLKSSMS